MTLKRKIHNLWLIKLRWNAKYVRIAVPNTSKQIKSEKINRTLEVTR